MADITILKGRTYRAIIGPMVKNDGSVFNLTSMNLRFMAKSEIDGSDESAILDLFIKIGGGGTVTDSDGLDLGGTDTSGDDDVVYTGASSGVVTLLVEDEKTEETSAGAYVWELVIMPTAGEGEVYQLLSGDLTIIDTLIDEPELA